MKELVTFQVTHRLGEVSGAVRFDDELGGFAVEVDNKGAQRMLASELRTVELSVAQKVPKRLLGSGG